MFGESTNKFAVFGDFGMLTWNVFIENITHWQQYIDEKTKSYKNKVIQGFIMNGTSCMKNALKKIQ